ncbi:ABC-2 type transport system permease protein [Kitasatospora sp. MAA19]|uniref:ABC transporter permease n=1 Tax=Kitasatospora sp. MAA19 TaxID=3035090 RepID=UPI00247671C2|nr:ABC transporter permease [Kitasatospora sp. MAA19]MDH6705284.1 ABC-2 type transport system permease protein [Kitasatospora sp. MAA19]
MHPRKSTFSHLVRTNYRELFRDGKTAFFVLGFPLFFMALFLGMGFVMSGGSYHVAVAPGPGQHQVVDRLNHVKGLTVKELDQALPGQPRALGGYDAVVQPEEGRPVVTVDAGKFGVVRGMRDALDKGTGASAHSVFRTPDGGVPFDPVKASLPTVLFIALMSAAFFGTATPLIGLRQRGTLRMLGTTPLKRRTFILAQAPVRLGLVMAQVVVVGTIAAICGFLAPGDALPVLVSGLLGALMLFGFGYLVAARMRNAEVANGLLAVLMPVTMLFSGLFLPMELMPGPLRAVSQAFPTTYLVDALSHAFTGAPSLHGLAVDWLVLAGSAVLLALLAARLFSWDQGEER